MTKHPPQFFLSLYGWTFWVPALLLGLAGIVVFLFIPHLAWLSVVFAVLTSACLAFYRDFNRPIPQEPNIMVAPADGKVSEITRLDRYEPFNGPALKIGIFLSVLDVHVNRSPADATILWTRYEEGRFLDARHPDCSAQNQSNTICLADTPAGPPTAVVKQIVGAIARRIIAPLTPGERLTRGQRIGMIAFGSRTELYVPEAAGWKPAVALGTHIKGGQDVIVRK